MTDNDWRERLSCKTWQCCKPMWQTGAIPGQVCAVQLPQSSEHAVISKCCTINYGGGVASTFKQRPWRWCQKVSDVKILHLTNSPCLATVQGVLRDWAAPTWAAVGVSRHGRMCVGVFKILKIGHAWEASDNRKRMHTFLLASRASVWIWAWLCLSLTRCVQVWDGSFIGRRGLTL